MNGTPVNFLVTSAGRRGELVSILRDAAASHGQGSVYCVDRSSLTAAGHLADGLDLVPPIADPAYVPALLEVCRRRGVGHLVPTIDTELAVLADNRDVFEEAGVRVWVSSPETIAIAQDKRATHRWLAEHSLPAPVQHDLAEALVLARAGELEFPRIAKPAGGSSSIGLARVDGLSDLERLDPALDHVVESVAPGLEHTVDVWVDAVGRCRAAVPRLRLETRAGEVSKGVTVRDAAVIDLATRACEALPGARYVLNVQVFHEPESGRLAVIEVNARFGGGFPLSWAAGARLPEWVLRDSPSDPSEAEAGAWQEDLLMLRYDQGVYLPRAEA